MSNPSEHVSSTLSFSTYSISIGLIFGDAWHFLNDNAGAIGASIAILTYLTNLIFNIRRERREKQ